MSLGKAAIRNLKEWYSRDYEFVRLCREKARQINYKFRANKVPDNALQPTLYSTPLRQVVGMI